MTYPDADLAELVAQTIYEGKLFQPARAAEPWGGEPSATKTFCRVTARDVLAVIDRVARVDSSLARRLSESMGANAQLRAENDRLRAALQFYADEWVTNSDGDPSTPGLSRSWLEPSDHLIQDEGRKAVEAIEGPKA